MQPSSALVFDPYLRSLGGGERYAYSVAEALEARYCVTVAAPVLPGADAVARAGLPARFEQRQIGWSQYTAATRQYDLVVTVANRLPPPTLCRRSFLVVQFPFRSIGPASPARAYAAIALRGYRCVVYSDFVRGWLQRRWRVASTVLEPPVEIAAPANGDKERLILGVGRFFVTPASKRQDALLEAYSRLPQRIRAEWRLVLAGQLDRAVEARAFVDTLRARAEPMGARILTSVSREALLDLFRRATFFWHAAGFERDAAQPERAEHFGIATVEAMAHGAVPLVFDDGAQRDIVRDEVGRRWSTLDELAEATQELIDAPQLRAQLATRGRLLAADFSPDRFRSRVQELMLD